jgi:hypothetical protein
MWLSIEKFTFVHIAIGHAVHTLSASLVIGKLAIIHVAIARGIDTTTVAHVAIELTDIFVAVRVDQRTDYNKRSDTVVLGIVGD